MEDPPKDPRVVAMIAVLFGNEWEKLDGDVAFDKTSMDSWVLAVETMLDAADAADPLRVAIRGVIEDGNSSERSGSAMPSRSDG